MMSEAERGIVDCLVMTGINQHIHRERVRIETEEEMAWS